MVLTMTLHCILTSSLCRSGLSSSAAGLWRKLQQPLAATAWWSPLTSWAARCCCRLTGRQAALTQQELEEGQVAAAAAYSWVALELEVAAAQQ
jgi:hypothetical protein